MNSSNENIVLWEGDYSQSLYTVTVTCEYVHEQKEGRYLVNWLVPCAVFENAQGAKRHKGLLKPRRLEKVRRTSNQNKNTLNKLSLNGCFMLKICKIAIQTIKKTKKSHV